MRLREGELRLREQNLEIRERQLRMQEDPRAREREVLLDRSGGKFELFELCKIQTDSEVV